MLGGVLGDRGKAVAPRESPWLTVQPPGPSGAARPPGELVGGGEGAAILGPPLPLSAPFGPTTRSPSFRGPTAAAGPPALSPEPLSCPGPSTLNLLSPPCPVLSWKVGWRSRREAARAPGNGFSRNRARRGAAPHAAKTARRLRGRRIPEGSPCAPEGSRHTPGRHKRGTLGNRGSWRKPTAQAQAPNPRDARSSGGRGRGGTGRILGRHREDPPSAVHGEERIPGKRGPRSRVGEANLDCVLREEGKQRLLRRRGPGSRDGPEGRGQVGAVTGDPEVPQKESLGR